VEVRFRLQTGTTYPLLLKGSDIARAYGFDRHNYAVIDHNGILRYRSEGTISRRFDEDAIRDAIDLALEDLRQVRAAAEEALAQAEEEQIITEDDPPITDSSEQDQEEESTVATLENSSQVEIENTESEEASADSSMPMEDPLPAENQDTENQQAGSATDSDMPIEDPLPAENQDTENQQAGSATDSDMPIEDPPGPENEQEPPPLLQEEDQPSTDNSMQMEDAEITTAATANETPDYFSLEANFPNPFNAATTIRFTLPQASPIRLRIYNIAGHLVAQKNTAILPAGIHTLSWDARGQTGELLASGVYFYRLETATTKQTRKMLFLQ
jgi:hypothetical protein